MTRIIAGSAKGKRLRTPAHSATRPTTDRVREAAFSLIADWAGTAGEPADRMLSGLAFLDLYAGSGAVALEAASRGAQPVWAVESDPATARLARDNATQTGLPLHQVTATVEKQLATTAPIAFDIVWADPPYHLANDRLAPMLAAVVDGGWLVADGLLVVERSSRDPEPPWPVALPERWDRRYGETTLHFAMKGRP